MYSSNMIIGFPQHVTYEFLILQETIPETGDYIDSRGRLWYARRVVEEAACVLRDPPAKGWIVTMTASDPFFTLKPGEELRRFFASSEVAIRRDLLRAVLQGYPNFLVVGTTEDNLTLVANFQGEVPPLEDLPIAMEGMPIRYQAV